MIQDIVSGALNESAPVVMEGAEQSEVVESPVVDKSKLDTLAVLARKEKKIMDERKSLGEQKKEFEAKMARLQELEELEALLNDNPLEVLKRKNIPVSKINELYLGEANDEDVDPMTARIAQLEKQVKEYQAKFDSKLSEEEEAKINGQKEKVSAQTQALITEIESVIKGNEAFELLESVGEGAAQQVLDLMQEMYNQSKEKNPDNPTILKPHEAAEMIENYLAEELKKTLSLKKVKALLGAKDSESDEIDLFSHVNENTLTDNYKSSSIITSDDLSEQQRIENAKKLLQTMIGG
jgi:hypothetical protein